MLLLFKNPTPIKNVEQDAIQTIEGKILAQKELLIPIFNIPCVYYSNLVESFTYGPMRKSRKMWYPVKYKEDICAFFITDTTGIIALVSIIKDIQIYNLNVKVLYNKSNRYMGNFLKNGDKIRVKGLITRNNDPLNKMYHIIPPPGKKIIIKYIRNKKFFNE